MCPNIEIKCIKKKVCFYFSTNNYKKIAWYLTLIVSNRDFEDVKFQVLDLKMYAKLSKVDGL